MSSFKVRVADLENPYRAEIASAIGIGFLDKPVDARSELDGMVAAITATNRVRFGPLPNPESLVAIRAVCRRASEERRPVRILCPWGSKKPTNYAGVDVAELGGLKMLRCLAARVQTFHTPGIEVRVRVEDAGGLFLFADEGAAARTAQERYVSEFLRLIRAFDVPFVQPILETGLVSLDEYCKLGAELEPLFVKYLEETDRRGLLGAEDLPSFIALHERGWQGLIPVEQRDFYRGRYARLYSGSSVTDQTRKLARYLAGSLARYILKATGSHGWGSDFIQLNFANPAPGSPQGIVERRVHYRTLPVDVAKTHIPPWRARGYLRVEGATITPKLASWSEELNLQQCVVELEGGGERVEFAADYMLV